MPQVIRAPRNSRPSALTPNRSNVSPDSVDHLGRYRYRPGYLPGPVLKVPFVVRAAGVGPLRRSPPGALPLSNRSRRVVKGFLDGRDADHVDADDG